MPDQTETELAREREAAAQARQAERKANRKAPEDPPHVGDLAHEDQNVREG